MIGGKKILACIISAYNLNIQCIYVDFSDFSEQECYELWWKVSYDFNISDLRIFRLHGVTEIKITSLI